MTLPQVYDILLLATWKSSESFKTAEEKIFDSNPSG